MTRTANARIAGFTFLFCIAVAFPNMVLCDRAGCDALRDHARGGCDEDDLRRLRDMVCRNGS